MDVELKDTIIDANTGADAIQRAPIVNYNTGKKCLRIGDISNQRKYNEWGYTEVNEENYKKYKLEKEDILIARTGSTIGINTFIEKDYKSVYNNGLIRLRINKSKYNSKFIYYVIQTNKFKNYINGIAFGTTGQPNMKIKDLLKFKFNDVPLEIQNKIVKVLDHLDKKIELNNQINDNLYEISKRLYKRWFIDYEFPNEDGKPYKSSGEKMIDSEIGEIPENWEIKQLDEISENYDSKRKPLSSRERKMRKGNIPYYGATSIIDYVDDYLFNDIYVLMGEDGSVINADNTPVLQYIWRKCWVNNHAHILKGKGISTEHLMECLRNTDVSPIITGAVQLKINQANMNTLKYCIPPRKINETFEKVLDKIYFNIRNNTEEIETLQQLRNTLLPKLMNGEINLENIEIKESRESENN